MPAPVIVVLDRPYIEQVWRHLVEKGVHGVPLDDLAAAMKAAALVTDDEAPTAAPQPGDRAGFGGRCSPECVDHWAHEDFQIRFQFSHQARTALKAALNERASE